MKRLIVNSRPIPKKQSNAVSSLYSRDLSITYGTVDSNNENGTCNVLLVTGFTLNGIKILSSIYPSKDPVIGGIKYPQVGAYVIILHPKEDINSGFILPAELDFTDDDVSGEFTENKVIEEGGWTTTFDTETGVKTITNGTFELIADPENSSFSLTDFEGNTFKSNGAIWEINGDADFAVAFNDLKTGFDQLKTDFNNLVTKYNAHIHVTTATIGASAVVGVLSATATSGASSTASIDDSKIDNVKFK